MALRTVAALTAYGVMALGVHWALDVLAALPFGLGCAALATRLTRARHHVASGAVADRVRVGSTRPERAQPTWTGRRTR